jgi:hypothetical protein
MKFVALREVGSLNTGGYIKIYFGIPVGREEAAGRELLACLAEGFEVCLCNDLDEGHEGLTEFQLLPSGLMTRNGGHGWSGQWKPVDEAGFLAKVAELANLNRGENEGRQGSLRRWKLKGESAS